MYREEQMREILTGHNILIAGYGREGRSAKKLIDRLLPNATCAVADGDEQISSSCSSDYDMIIKSPGVPMRLLDNVRDRVTSLTDIFLQIYGDQTIGVTGTKGKSTTASLIHHLLPGSILAGNIGIPLFDILDLLDKDSIVVAELSCHQLEVLHRSPHIALILNFYQEHLDHYKDYQDYKMAKLQIALHQNADDHFFYCRDNEELCDMIEQGGFSFQGSLHPYSLSKCSEEERLLLKNLTLAGDHNMSNALVACRIAKMVASYPHDSLVTSLASFHGLRHRMEYIGCYGGIKWYDDSISTIPAAAIAAMQALEHVDTLIVGGFDRGIDYSPLVEYLTLHPVANLAFVGVAGRRVEKQLIKKQRFIVEDDYSTIVQWCASVTPVGGTVLLSPAAASYDAFKNFEHRGDYFAEQVKKL